MTKYLICFLFFLVLQFTPLFPAGQDVLHPISTKHVELIANFDIDANYLTSILEKHHFPARVERCDLSQFGENLKRFPKSWFQIFRWKSPLVEIDKDIIRIVFWNMASSWRKEYDLSKLPKEKLVLFMWEPPIILRKMYSAEVTQYFSKIYTWDDDLVDNELYFKFYYPVLRPMIDDIPSFEEKKLCTLIATNVKKNFPNELYSERIKVIDFFETREGNDFEFYGKNWDATRYKCYRGAIPDKIEVLKNYRFSICYENTKDIKGYITEKIFDCFAAGNIPVYWGASNIEQHIPRDCFIDRRDFKNLEDLYEYLKKMNKEEYEAYLSNIRNFLVSKQAHSFSVENFERIFYEAVSK